MLALLGALAFGVVCAGAWIKSEGDEQYSKNRSKDKDIPLYFDKWGNVRHTDTGKKYIGEEFIQGFKIRDEELKKQKQKWEDEQKIKYYVIRKFKINYNENKEPYPTNMTIEIFDELEKAEQFQKILIEKYKEKGLSRWKIPGDCSIQFCCDIDIKIFTENKYNVHYNFERS